MEQSEIIEGNKLIAEFMDTVWNEKGKHKSYQSNWTFLMPVVEKISRIEYERWEDEDADGEKKTVIDTAYPRTFGMLSDEGKPMFRFNRCFLFEADTLIEAAWEAVVDFLKDHTEKV